MESATILTPLAPAFKSGILLNKLSTLNLVSINEDGHFYIKKMFTQANNFVEEMKALPKTIPRQYKIQLYCSQYSYCWGPRGFGDLGRMAIYFQGAGEHL